MDVRDHVGLAQGSKAPLTQGGTFSANPVSMVAGRLAMEALTKMLSNVSNIWAT